MPITITHLPTGRVLADRAEIARSLPTRLIGLLARRTFQAGEALIFPRCNTIHTCLMRFSIDVVFVRTGGVLSTPSAWPDNLSALPAAARQQAGVPSGTGQAGNGSAGIVVKAIPGVRPFRIVGALGADTTIELPVGTLSKTPTAIGERLLWTQ